jgi:biotin-(acetyl-CoA carboxylase) ligase
VHSSTNATDQNTPPEETDKSEKALRTESTKTSESNCELWDRALKHLQTLNEDRDIVAVIEKIAQTIASDKVMANGGPDTVKGIAKDIKEQMELRIECQEKDNDTYRFVQRTVSILNKFVSGGDVAVSFDPVHAALPWAAIRFVLVVRRF